MNDPRELTDADAPRLILTAARLLFSALEGDGTLHAEAITEALAEFRAAHLLGGIVSVVHFTMVEDRPGSLSELIALALASSEGWLDDGAESTGGLNST